MVMRILHLLYESEGDHFGIGGVGVRAYEIYRLLAERHDITLLCKNYPGAEDREEGSLRHMHVGSGSGNFTSATLSYACEARKYVKTRGADYDVVVEEFSPAVPTFLNLYKKTPLVLQVQGYTGARYFGKYNPLYSVPLYVLEKLRTAGYENMVFVSEATRQRFHTAGKGAVAVIPNGVDKQLLLQEPGEGDEGAGGYILYLGRIDVHTKGLDTLLEAYQLVRLQYPGTRLVVAGDGRDKDRFYTLLEALPMDVRRDIETPGWVRGRRKRELLRDALLFVQPSRYESQPITVLEAAASAKPIVASNINELRVVEEQGAGLCVRPESPDELARAMGRFLRDRGFRKRCGKEGRKWASAFGWEKAAMEFEEFLLKSVEGFSDLP